MYCTLGILRTGFWYVVFKTSKSIIHKIAIETLSTLPVVICSSKENKQVSKTIGYCMNCSIFLNYKISLCTIF